MDTTSTHVSGKHYRIQRNTDIMSHIRREFESNCNLRVKTW